MYFVDYGNYDLVDLPKLRNQPHLLAQIIDTPRLCYECKLHGVRPKDDKWDTAVLTGLHNAILGELVTVTQMVSRYGE